MWPPSCQFAYNRLRVSSNGQWEMHFKKSIKERRIQHIGIFCYIFRSFIIFNYLCLTKPKFYLKLCVYQLVWPLLCNAIYLPGMKWKYTKLFYIPLICKIIDKCFHTLSPCWLTRRWLDCWSHKSSRNCNLLPIHLPQHGNNQNHKSKLGIIQLRIYLFKKKTIQNLVDCRRQLSPFQISPSTNLPHSE